MQTSEYWMIVTQALFYELSRANIDFPIKANDSSLAKTKDVKELLAHLEVSLITNKDDQNEIIHAARKMLSLNWDYLDVQPVELIFSYLSLEHPAPEEKPSHSYLPLEKVNAFCSGNAGVSISALMEKFRGDLMSAIETASTAEQFFSMCVRLMERYTWCFRPVVGLPGISLYDNSSLLSAVSACLYQQKTSDIANAGFRLLVADFSGIQRYIFGQGEQQKGAAKRLRARSFIVTMVMQLVRQLILKRFNLPSTCTLMNSGGNLHILLPERSGCLGIIEGLQQELDAEVYRLFSGEVSIHLTSIAFEAADLSDFGSLVQSADQALNEAKRQAFKGLFVQNGTWNTAEPIELTGRRDQKLCAFCGKEFSIRENERIGERCTLEQKIGRNLLRAGTVSIIQSESGFLTLCGLSASFGKEGNDNFALRSDDPETQLFPVLRTVNYVPAMGNGEVLDFEDISQNAKGSKKLAVLKADVDKLGMLFALGFRNDGDTAVHVLRSAALSRMLEYFFSEWLGFLIRESYSNCYTVFSGGDDLVVIGPWNEIIDFALDMQRNLSLYCGGNPSITISAAVEMLSSKSPVSIAVHNAEISLSKAKDKGDLIHDPGRDQFHLFGRSMKWDRAHQIIGKAKTVSGWRAKNILNSADIYKMRTWALMFQEYYRNGDSLGLKYASFISYDIGRKMDETATREKVNTYKGFWLGLRDIKNDLFIHYLQVICDYALFINRKEGQP